MLKSTLVPCLLVALVGPGLAQTSAKPTSEDVAFLTKATKRAVFELVSAKLASEKAMRDDVKRYAAKLVSDHAAYNATLRDLLKTEGVEQPNDIEDSARATMADLENASGPAFDKAYIAAAVRTHAEDKRDTEHEQESTKVEAIKQFIRDSASMDAEHEKLAKALAE